MQIIAANIDRVYLVVTLKSPETQVAFIDRFLVAAEAYRIPTTILVNKIDLYGFSSSQISDKNYVEIIDLFNNFDLIFL